MIAQKHTPGPWVADDDQYDTDVILITTIDRLERSMVEIAKIDVGFNDPFEAEQQSNARVIAAAPEVLEALRDLLVLAQAHYPIPAAKGEIVRARAAIAKATGQ